VQPALCDVTDYMGKKSRGDQIKAQMSLLPISPLPLEVGPLNPAKGSGGAL